MEVRPVSIDATITNVTRSGVDAILYLAPAADSRAPAGQTFLRMEDAPPGIEAAVGTRIWSDNNYIMINNERWATRIGFSRIRLVPRVPG
jgi:hypothetical protein